MTFKHLKKRVSLEATQQESKLFGTLRNKPFWTWDKQQHKLEDVRTGGDCCFNHIIGLPQKDAVDKPFYEYEKMIFDCLVSQNGNIRSFNKKHLWIKKATGLGVSEFMLRFMAWLCLKDDKLSGSQMCIVTGPRIDLAIALIDRMKRLFAGKGLIIFDTKETIIELNGVKIEAFPSHHLDAMRGLPNVSFILLDEADFFPPGQQQDARDVSERYIAKSNPYIVMVSTPNAPEGLFERIEKESEDTCLYKRIFLDYTYGIGKIYTAGEIEKAKQSPSFEREYNLKYLGKIGNVFHTKDIEAAIEKGKKYNPDNFNQSIFTSTSMGVDPAYGSSAFGIVVTRFADGIVRILYADEYHRPDYNEMLSAVYGLMTKYSVDKVYIDGANPSFIKSLKIQIGEEADYDKVIARYRSEGYGDEAALNDMKVAPVNFNKEHKAMLGHCKMILERDGGRVAVNPDKFDKLITSLRTAVDNDGTLDKEATSYNDIFDAFRLALKFYHFEECRDE
ncbi:MAG TPA: DEAD/DEAH box helicase family protein [Nitrososphaeraceae archaeon]|nr:DEAD/DEAH box helicase family protein [Nitrososphaeraceae archaeon]